MTDDTDDKPAKKTREKKNPEHVAFKNAVVDVLLKPTRRRMVWLYPHLCDPDKGLLVLGLHPRELVFGNPEEGLYVVRYTDVTVAQSIWSWLTRCGMTKDRLEAINIGSLASALGKAQDDPDKVVTYMEGDSLYIQEVKNAINASIYSLFTLNRLVTQLETFLPVLDNDASVFLDFPMPVIKDVPQHAAVLISAQLVANSPLAGKFFGPIKIPMVRGYDLLCAHHLPIQPTLFGLRVWYITGSTIRYAAVIEHPDFTAVSARSNLFLIPIVQKDNDI